MILISRAGVIHPAAWVIPNRATEGFRKPAGLILFVTLANDYSYKINRLPQEIGAGFRPRSYILFSTQVSHLTAGT
jgi:hypothetical protein